MRTPFNLPYVFKAAALVVATALTVTAADPNVSSEKAADESTSRSVGGNNAQDRNDTIRSNETRINTTGREIEETDVSKLSRGDRRFLEKASKQGLAEARLARLAAERSGDPRIRSFAQQIVTSHEKSNAELLELAARKGMNLTPDGREGDRVFNNMSERTGEDFDNRFIEQMSDSHEEAVDLFEKAARKSDDADVAAFASKHLPVLQQHRTLGSEIEAAVKR